GVTLHQPVIRAVLLESCGLSDEIVGKRISRDCPAEADDALIHRSAATEILIARKFASGRYGMPAVKPADRVPQLIDIRDFPESVACGRSEETRHRETRQLRGDDPWENCAVIRELIAALRGHLRVIPIDTDAEFVQQ